MMCSLLIRLKAVKILWKSRYIGTAKAVYLFHWQTMKTSLGFQIHSTYRMSTWTTKTVFSYTSLLCIYFCLPVVQVTKSSSNMAVNNIENEFHELNSKNAWEKLYQSIIEEVSKYNVTVNESQKPKNSDLNRYSVVIPYDHSRIILKKGQPDYINANLVKVDKAQRQYILTQGPLPNTAAHFWQMAWEQNSKAVIMLNKVIEENRVKCHQYYPLENSSNEIMKFPEYDLEVHYISIKSSSNYEIRTLRLKNTKTNETRDILHFHYTTWPDFGVPETPTAFLEFLNDIRQSGAFDENFGPPIVHCSAGIGRSGTFALIDSCLVLIQKNGSSSIDVKEVLLEIRKFRIGLVQTADQLRFAYAAIIEGAKHQANSQFDKSGFFTLSLIVGAAVLVAGIFVIYMTRGITGSRAVGNKSE